MIKHCLFSAIFLVCLALSFTGCGTTRFSDSTRTATEMVLISDAVDQVVSNMDFNVLSGKKVYLDPQYLECKTDKGYVVSSLRQHLLAHGCLLMDKRESADYVVEARCGALGTDRHDLLFGIPQMQLPAVMPGVPTTIPEIPFAKRTNQQGIAKIAVFAFNRNSGQPVWQSGTVQESSSSSDLWVIGAGPFRRGSVRKQAEFAGETIAIPFIFEHGPEGEESKFGGVRVTHPAVWFERRPSRSNAHILVGHEEKKNN